MVWLIPVLGLLAGILIGSIVSIQIPLVLAKYLSIAVLAALDSALGGVRCIYENNFNGLILLTGFISNALLAAFLAFLGDQLSVDLYMAAVFCFWRSHLPESVHYSALCVIQIPKKTQSACGTA